ncbi:MAG: segregation/condensation protein A [Clostridium botulinum]|nr:segregation/condensation protein A [Clostridium botulinum]
MPLNIKIHNFDGPFDLLLHLIKKNKMEIYDVSIYEITNQYLQYLNRMEELDLEITSEFIVMAATLIEIKSKYLLPKVEEEKEEEENDPQKELLDKLLEYKKFKAAAEFFKTRQKISGTSFSKKPEIIEVKNKETTTEELLKDVTMLSLYNTYNDLINKYSNKMNENVEFKGEIQLDKYKIEDKIEYIGKKISSKEKWLFSDFIKECSCKMEIVVTFLAILELIKLKTIQVYQSNNFNDIHIERGVVGE